MLRYMKGFICSFSPNRGLGKHLLTPGASNSQAYTKGDANRDDQTSAQGWQMDPWAPLRLFEQ